MKNKTVLRAVEILNLIAKNPDGITFTEIVKALDIPKSTIYDILQSLYHTDCVYFKDEKVKSYAIGSTIFTLGLSYSKTSNFINVCKNYITEVCEKIDQPIIITKLVVDRIVHVYKEEPKRAVLKTSSLGVDEEGIMSSVGKLLIAFSEYYPSNLKELGIDNPFYIKELERIIEDKYVIGFETEGKNTITIAVPVYNFENRVCGVVSTIGIYIPSQDYSEELGELKKMAENMSRDLGYKGYD